MIVDFLMVFVSAFFAVLFWVIGHIIISIAFGVLGFLLVEHIIDPL